MSYKLEYPYTEQERLDFIVQYNHQQGLRIETVDNFVEEEIEDVSYPTYYALEANEIMEGGEPVINPNYEKEQEQKERERIAKLSLTKREVFLGLYQARGISPDVIRQNINDTQALIEFDYANSYFRGNPLIDGVGAMLGITPEQLDKFFDEANKGNPFAWSYLVPPTTDEEIIEEPVVDNSEPVDEENSVTTETEPDEV